MLKLKLLLLALLPFGLTVTNSYAGDANTLVSIPSPGYTLIKKATLIKPVEPNKKFKLIAWLKLRNKTELDQLVDEIYDPNSPNYQQYLTQDVFEEHYAPTKEVEYAIQNYFTAQGMQADIVNHSVQVTASAQQIAHVLHTNLNYYLYNAHTVYANTNKPALPAEIAQYIVDITGLNNIPLYSLNNVSAKTNVPFYDYGFIEDSFFPNTIPTKTSLKGFSGAQLQYTYNINNIPPVKGTHLDGKGQTIIIVDPCAKNSVQQILSDANQYFSANGIKPFFISGQSRNFAVLNQNLTPYTNVCGLVNPASDGEIVIDVESSHTIAPGDNTVLVITDGDLLEIALKYVIAYLISHNFTIAGFSNSYVISNSWGALESSVYQPNTSIEQSLQTAAAFGISVQFSSGDCGDNTYTDAKHGKCQNKGKKKSVNYPASSPYATGVGATSVFVDANYNYAFENVWGSYAPKEKHFIVGTSGGISQFYQAPVWQGSISSFYAGGYGYINDTTTNAICGITANKPCRAVPDISMLGDPNTGLNLVFNGSFGLSGGTSLACPLYSGVVLLINQARELLKKNRIGQTAPYLFKNNSILLSNRALNLIVPPIKVMDGVTAPDPNTYPDAPSTSFILRSGGDIWGWDSSLTSAPESQFWNDAVGLGSPNLPNFVPLMANI